jgi:hypothetical protein
MLTSELTKEGDKGKHISDGNELVDDLLAIVNVFVARNNGRRSAQKRRERKEEGKSGGVKGEENKEDEGRESGKEQTRSVKRQRTKQPVSDDQSVSFSPTENHSEEVVRDVQMDI